MTKAATQAQIARAIKGAELAGFPVDIVELPKDGTIRLLRARDKAEKKIPTNLKSWEDNDGKAARPDR